MWKRFFERRKKFFQDHKNLESMMRKMVYTVIIFVVVYPFTLFFGGIELTSIHVTLELGLAGLAFGAKVAQKKLSEKETPEP